MGGEGRAFDSICGHPTHPDRHVEANGWQLPACSQEL